MRIGRHFLLGFLLFAPSVNFAQTPSPPSTVPPTPSLKIGFVDNAKNQYQNGCGCSFWPPGRQPKFADPRTQQYILSGNDKKLAWMKVNGTIVRFRLVKDTTRMQGKQGDRYYQMYQSRDTRVQVACTASGFGDTHAVYCDATITITRGRQKRTVKAEGSCGC